MLSRTVLRLEFVSASRFVLISAHLQDIFVSCCCCSAPKQCQTLCNPMDCTTSGFPIFNYLPELAQTHVHWVSDAIQPFHPVTSFSSCLQSFPASGSFQVSWLFASGGQSIGASASVLPMNIQGWFPLELTGLISLQSSDCQESSPAPQFKNINSSALSLPYGSALTSVHDYWKNLCLNHLLWIYGSLVQLLDLL